MITVKLTSLIDMYILCAECGDRLGTHVVSGGEIGGCAAFRRCSECKTGGHFCACTMFVPFAADREVWARATGQAQAIAAATLDAG